MPENGGYVFRGECEQMRRHRDGRRVGGPTETRAAVALGLPYLDDRFERSQARYLPSSESQDVNACRVLGAEAASTRLAFEPGRSTNWLASDRTHSLTQTAH